MVRLYFEEASFEAFSARPSIFSEAELKVQQGQPPEMQSQGAARLIRKEASRSLTEFVDFLSEKTVPAIVTEEERHSLALLAALRNIIVHGDKFPDDKFHERVAGLQFEYEELPSGRVRLEEPWLLSRAPICERMIFSYDDRLVRSFDIKGHFRYGLFWLNER